MKTYSMVVRKILILLFLSVTTLYLIYPDTARAIPSNENTADILIPETYGITYQPPAVPTSHSNKQVVLIKDAHCIYEAQENIKHILEILVSESNFELICVEGASGLVDTSLFQSFPDKSALKKACDKFVKQGYLTASEAFSVCQGRELGFTLWGVEDEELYFEDLRLFRETMSHSKKTEKFITVSLETARLLKDNIYNPELKKFDRLREKFQEDQLDLSAWITYLAGQPGIPEGHENMDLVLAAIQQEKEIDFKKVER